MKNKSIQLLVVLTLISASLTTLADTSAEPLNDPQIDYPGSPEKPLTSELISKLMSLNNDGQVYDAWSVLADQKDGYAKSATHIFGSKITVERCVVESNWKIVVGDEVRERLFLKYAQQYQRHYIDFLDTNHRYPNTLDIEKMYQRTDDELELPQSVSVDLMMNLVPTDWKRRTFFDGFSSLIGIGRSAHPKLWFHYTKISQARVMNESITAQDITVEQAKEIYKKTAGKVASCMAKLLKPTKTPVQESIYNE